MTETDTADFENLVAIAAPELEPIMRSLRDLVMKIDPDACVVVRLGDRAATFGVGPKKMSEGYCYIMPHRRWINLGFYRGAHLPDPDSLLEGSGKNMRHVKIRSQEETGNPSIEALIESALSERRAALE
jgi:hypothetical protein